MACNGFGLCYITQQLHACTDACIHACIRCRVYVHVDATWRGKGRWERREGQGRRRSCRCNMEGEGKVGEKRGAGKKTFM
eukprot:358604-Chlamydomonas_euryale.AAC.3